MCICPRGVSRGFSPLECCPGSLELPETYPDTASKLFAFTFTFTPAVLVEVGCPARSNVIARLPSSAPPRLAPAGSDSSPPEQLLACCISQGGL